MFDIGWSEFLIVAIVTLIVVGPKQMPLLLRTIGRYVGMAKRQAAEFQNQVEQAIKEAELDDIKDEMTSLRGDVEATVEDTKRAVETDIGEAREGLDEAAKAAQRDDLVAADVDTAMASNPDPEKPPAQTGDR